MKPEGLVKPEGRTKLNRGQVGRALLAVALIFGVLTLVFWDFVRETIVIPIYYLFWYGGLVVNSIPQAVYLLLLVAVAVVIGLNTLSRLEARGAYGRRAGAIGFEDQSRYQFWLRLCASAPSSEFSRSNLAREIRNLLLAIWAYQHGTGIAEAEQHFLNGAEPRPAAVDRLMRHKELAYDLLPPQRFSGLRRRLQQLLRRPEPPDAPVTNPALEDIVHYIESQLEIARDGNRSTF